MFLCLYKNQRSQYDRKLYHKKCGFTSLVLEHIRRHNMLKQRITKCIYVQ